MFRNTLYCLRRDVIRLLRARDHLFNILAVILHNGDRLQHPHAKDASCCRDNKPCYSYVVPPIKHIFKQARGVLSSNVGPGPAILNIFDVFFSPTEQVAVAATL